MSTFTSVLSGSPNFSGKGNQPATTSALAGVSTGVRSSSSSRRPRVAAFADPGGRGLDTVTRAGPTATPDTRNVPSGWIGPDFGTPSDPITCTVPNTTGL